jgi:hypothetical protein
MNFIDLSFWQSFFSNLLATVIGVGLGIPVALLINRWIESRTESEKKEKILKLIHEDLKNNCEIISEWFEDPNINKLELLIVHTRYELWSAFADGGELQWIKDPEILTYLAEAFACVRNVTDLARNFYNNQLFNKPRSNMWVFYNNDLLKAVDYALEMIEHALRTVYNEDIPIRDFAKEINEQFLAYHDIS